VRSFNHNLTQYSEEVEKITLADDPESSHNMAGDVEELQARFQAAHDTIAVINKCVRSLTSATKPLSNVFRASARSTNCLRPRRCPPSTSEMRSQILAAPPVSRLLTA